MTNYAQGSPNNWRLFVVPCRTCGGDCPKPWLCPNFNPGWEPTKENAFEYKA